MHLKDLKLAKTAAHESDALCKFLIGEPRPQLGLSHHHAAISQVAAGSYSRPQNPRTCASLIRPPVDLRYKATRQRAHVCTYNHQRQGHRVVYIYVSRKRPKIQGSLYIYLLSVFGDTTPRIYKCARARAVR